VLVCEAQTALSDALREVLHEMPGIGRAAPASSVREARHEAERLRPEIAVVTTHLSGGDAIETARAIREEAPRCVILLLAATEDADLLLRGSRVGVRGYITVGSDVSDFVRAIVSLQHGDVAISPALMGLVWDRLIGRSDDEPEDARLARLSSREREVLRLLAEGGNKGSIAGNLFISPDTVRSHLQNIFAKLSVRSKLQAVSVVMNEGWMQTLGVGSTDGARRTEVGAGRVSSTQPGARQSPGANRRPLRGERERGSRSEGGPG
jgi:DNA-binding NarL/FixJ family response regulator